MAGKRQPVALLQAKGKKHLTKAEIALREAQELHPDADNVVPPKWLKAAQKRRFEEIAAQLIDLGIMTNLDCEALARLVQIEAEYITITKQIDSMPFMVDVEAIVRGPDSKPKIGDDGLPVIEKRKVVNEQRDELDKMRERLWKRCRQGATDFGLTISGRCRLVAPKAKDEKPANKFVKYAKEKADSA